MDQRTSLNWQVADRVARHDGERQRQAGARADADPAYPGTSRPPAAWSALGRAARDPARHLTSIARHPGVDGRLELFGSDTLTRVHG